MTKGAENRCVENKRLRQKVRRDFKSLDNYIEGRENDGSQSEIIFSSKFTKVPIF